MLGARQLPLRGPVWVSNQRAEQMVDTARCSSSPAVASSHQESSPGHGNANCIGKSVSGLTGKYGTFLNEAPALGYSVKDLLNEVVIYCGG